MFGHQAAQKQTDHTDHEHSFGDGVAHVLGAMTNKLKDVGRAEVETTIQSLKGGE